MTQINESALIAEAVQDILQAMPEFLSPSVFIVDWSKFDESEAVAPWVLILQPGLQSSLDNTLGNGCDVNTWIVPIKIRIPFFDWNPDLIQLASLRDAVLLTFTNARALGLASTGFFSLKEIADASPLDPIVGRSFTDEGATLPDVLDLDMVLTVETMK